MRSFRTSSHAKKEHHQGRHRFEHWYRDNSVYFITSKVRDGRHVFLTPDAQAVFFDRLEHWSHAFGMELWIATLMSNHYHLIGYLKDGRQLGQIMRRVHGSVANLVNDLLDHPHKPFWRERGGRDYFDGCLRDERQYGRAYRYTRSQSVRHGVCSDWTRYTGTRIYVPMEEGLRRAVTLDAFMQGVKYPRYGGRAH